MGSLSSDMVRYGPIWTWGFVNVPLGGHLGTDSVVLGCTSIIHLSFLSPLTRVLGWNAFASQAKRVSVSEPVSNVWWMRVAYHCRHNTAHTFTPTAKVEATDTEVHSQWTQGLFKALSKSICLAFYNWLIKLCITITSADFSHCVSISHNRSNIYRVEQHLMRGHF